MNNHLRIVLLFTLVVNTHDVTSQRLSLGMVTDLKNDSLLHASGFEFIGTTVGSLIAPTIADSTFHQNVLQLKTLRTKIFMCNVLFPGSIKIAGPEADEQRALVYLEGVLRRAKVAGVPNLILGSGGARRLPDNYLPSTALPAFIVLCRKMAELAQSYGVTIILENLNSGETNFLNKLSEAAEIVRRVNHPHFRLNADIYHMMREGESPDEIVRAGNLIVYCEIAEKEKRTLPGMAKDDFGPYLRALKKINFTGPIMIEGNFVNRNTDVPAAFQYLTHQLAEAGFRP
jgi:sugar phosphate isomerase/epimerase